MHIEGLIVDLKMIGLKGDGPTWTAEQLPDVTQFSGLDGGSGASWYIPGYPTPAAEPVGARGQPERLDRSVTGGFLERLAARSAATGTVLCLGLDPDPTALPAGFARRRPRDRGVLAAPRRGLPAATSAAVKAEPGLLRGVRAGRHRRPRAGPRLGPGRRAVHRRREARRHRLDRRPPGGRPVRPARARTRSRPARTSGRRRSTRSSSGRTASSTSCAGRRTPGPASSRTSSSRRPTMRPAEPLFERVARRAGALGPGPDGRARRRRDGARRDGPRPGRRAGTGLPRARRRGPGRRDRAGPAARSGERADRPATAAAAACS